MVKALADKNAEIEALEIITYFFDNTSTIPKSIGFNNLGALNRNFQLTIALKAKKQIDTNYPVDPNYSHLTLAIQEKKTRRVSRGLTWIM